VAARSNGSEGGAGQRDVEAPPHFTAHAGMYRSAQAIAKDIDDRGVLASLIEEHTCSQLTTAGSDGGSNGSPGWSLMVVGHSLGAGVGALLTLHLRSHYPRLNPRCWAYAPPGGLISPTLAPHLEKHCISVIVGRDLVPRLSLRWGWGGHFCRVDTSAKTASACE
jgi:sn1-specific diacylglycerol lipase